MLLIGLGFIALSIVVFLAVKPRNGVIKLKDRLILEPMAGVTVTGAAVIGILMTVMGIAGF